VLKDDVFVGPHVVFTDDPHPMNCPRYQDCKGGAVVRRLARIGAVVAGNPARVIKQVAALTCPPGWFERPYTWPRYEPPGSGEKGSPPALSSPFALPRTGAFSAEVFGARAATQHADTALMAARLRLAAISAGDPTLNLLVHHALGHYCRHRRLGAEALVMRRRANAIDHCASCAILQP